MKGLVRVLQHPDSPGVTDFSPQLLPAGLRFMDMEAKDALDGVIVHDKQFGVVRVQEDGGFDFEFKLPTVMRAMGPCVVTGDLVCSVRVAGTCGCCGSACVRVDMEEGRKRKKKGD